MIKVRSPKVLLVGWDAADWKVIHPLMDEGKMPTVRRLVEEGTMANLATLHPVLSPMLWTSIATGKRPWKHGIHGFSEPTSDGTGIQPITNLSRKTKAIWNILSQKGVISNVVGWWPSHPAEPIRGVMVSNHFQRALGPPDRPWPTPPGAVHPERLTQTLADLRLNPNELLAEHILPFIPQAAEIDQEKDHRLASCAKILAECTSVHAVATWLMENEPCDFMAVYFDAIDHFCHAFMRYHPPRQEHIREQDFLTYQGVVEAAYRYHDMMLHRLLQLAGPDTTVILMSDHGFHPDHLRPQVLPAEPAGPAHEHRDFGILVMHGPGVKKDAMLHGPNLLDITPTLLTLFGLPVGADMDGQPLLDAFADPPKFELIPSWDEVQGEDGRHPPNVQLDPVQSREAIQQLVALGYIEPPGPDREKAIARTVRELRYNLARSYMDADQYREAAKILERLYDEWPDEHRFGVQLAMSYRALDRIADLRMLVEDLTSRRKQDTVRARAALRELLGALRARRRKEAPPAAPKTAQNRPTSSDITPPVHAGEASAVESGVKNDPESLMSPQEQRRFRSLRARAHNNPSAMDYLWSCVFLAEGDYEQALERLRRSEQRDAKRPGLSLQIGEAYLKLQRPEDAELAFRNAAKIDPDNPHAQLGLCRSHLLRRQNRMAAEKALRTIGLLYHYPMAHYCLGVALHRMGRVLAAVDALQIALSLNPNFAEAHERLAKIFRNRLGDHDMAQEHRRQARQMRAARRKALAAKGQYRPRPVRDSPADHQRAVHLATPDTDKKQSKHPDEVRQEGNSDSPIPKRRATNATQKPAVVTGNAASCIITVVSGLPRSGTSMVMQMLASGGMSMVTDGIRAADTSNLRGYYEDERVKKLRTDDSWLGEVQGMAIKIIAQLLPCLPPRYHYRILYVDRDMDEVMESQYAMLRCTGKEGSQINVEHLKQVFVAQTLQVKQWLARRQNIETLSLDHRTIIEDPTGVARQICDFVPEALNAKKMASAVDRSLYRSRHFVKPNNG